MTATFLSADLIDEILKESSGSGRYVNPSKIEGELRLRLFGTGVSGFEGWTDENKPVRWELKPTELPSNIKVREGQTPLKRFIAIVVYDYSSQDFKILQMTQKTLMEQLFKYVKDEEYGDATQYDIKISKTGEGMKTEYTLLAAPPRPVAKDIQAAYEKDGVRINLQALFDGDDPFAEASA
jgi:hypothetical protein